MKILLGLIALSFMAGCSSLQSQTVQPTENPAPGLVYFMPKKDLIVTVIVSTGTAENPTPRLSVTFGVTPAYPDISKKYLLRHANGLFGKNVADVGIKNGLLTDASSTMTSNVGEAIKAAAGSFAALDALDDMCGPGTYTAILDFGELNGKSTEGPCGIEVSAIRKVASDANDMSVDEKKIAFGEPDGSAARLSGLFYRRYDAYIVTASKSKGKPTIASDLLFSPSMSPVYFLPISKTLFANNKAEFTFDDGVPTKYKQDTDSEAVALLKIPADILTAYFTAVGTVFTGLVQKNTGETNVMNANVKLEIAKLKYSACLDAIQKKDDASIILLKCNE